LYASANIALAVRVQEEARAGGLEHETSVKGNVTPSQDTSPLQPQRHSADGVNPAGDMADSRAVENKVSEMEGLEWRIVRTRRVLRLRQFLRAEWQQLLAE
jgi:hypothetical protein